MRKFLLISMVFLTAFVFSQEGWVTESFGPITWQQPSDWQKTPSLGLNSEGVFKGTSDGQTLTQGVGVFFIYDVGVEESLISGLSQDASLVDQKEVSWNDFKGRYYRFEGTNLVFDVRVFPMGMKDLAIWSFMAGNPPEEDLQSLERILSSVNVSEHVSFSNWKSSNDTLEIFQSRNHIEGFLGERVIEGIMIENNIFGWWKKVDSLGTLGPSNFWDGVFSGRVENGKLNLLFSDVEDPFSITDGTSVVFENTSGEIKHFPEETVSLIESLFCRSVYENTPFATDDTFTLFDKRIVMWSNADPFENSHIFKWEWYDPSGSLRETVYYIVAPAVETGYDYYDSVWGWIPADSLGENDLGNWKVMLYIDGEKTAEGSFKLSRDISMKTIETDTFRVDVPSYTYYELSEGIHYFIFDIANLTFAEIHYETEPLENGGTLKTSNYEVNFIESSMPDYETGRNFLFWIVQFPEKEGQYLYMSFYAPEEDFKRLESVFESILNSLELK
ncbi:hypothetical protein [Thermotoga sp. SG1]|uniref:hypothetical protein n=1 Tax=Thermotoga sp. SG1 TaxID=126739 RepID=UPI000C78C237|nr:hypothetical protein [Thermotoga sp. SG1]PLV57681.1 hypothetical protein AS006_02065 [Thermotoga sp. SG1]